MVQRRGRRPRYCRQGVRPRRCGQARWRATEPRARRHAGWRYNDKSWHFIPATSSDLTLCHNGSEIAAADFEERGRVGDRAAVLRTLTPRGRKCLNKFHKFVVVVLMIQRMKDVSKYLTVNVRQVLFACIPLTYFFYSSVSYLINNQPEKFSDFGLVISLWSLFSLSVHRYRFNNIISGLELRISEAFREEKETQQAFIDEALSLTFDLHASQIAQISAILGQPNPFVENNQQALNSFCKDVEKRLAAKELFEQRQISALTKIRDQRQDLESEVKVFREWETYLWYFEVFLVAWGAVQISHGQEIVLLIHTLNW